MLYLEDYVESEYLSVSLEFICKETALYSNVVILVIEHLPQELRDRFTDMREMDLSVHSNYAPHTLIHV